MFLIVIISLVALILCSSLEPIEQKILRQTRNGTKKDNKCITSSQEAKLRRKITKSQSKDTFNKLGNPRASIDTHRSVFNQQI